MPFIHPRGAKPSLDEMGRYSVDSEFEVDDSLSQRQDSTWGSKKKSDAKWASHAADFSDASSDEEDFVHARFTRDDLRPFERAPYPPQAPDGRDLPRAVDDDFWPNRKSTGTDYNTGLPLPSVAAYEYERYHAPQQQRQQYPYAHPESRQLPPLKPYRAQHMAYPPVDPYGFTSFAASFAPPVAENPAVTKDILATALSQWYATRVVELLIQPGFFRPGVAGADTALWGRAGRERDEWRRVGCAAPRETNSWGRMGMEPVPSPRYAPAVPTVSPPRASPDSLPRCAELEQRDPFNLGIDLFRGPSDTLVAFVKSVMAQMMVSPVGLFSALWFLQGLGWHAGDGAKGARLRAFLQSLWHPTEQPLEAEGIERRVVVLGMLLANKWLDDNTFTNRSWSDVTHIPIGDIAKLEAIALNDLHYSLYISPSSWTTHLSQIHHHLSSGSGALELTKPYLTGLINHIDGLFDDAALVEIRYGPVMSAETQDLAYARDQFIAWNPLPANPWAVDNERLRLHDAYDHPGAGMGWGREAEVDMDVTDSWNDKRFAGFDSVQEVFMDDDDDVEEEEFLEYDGAQVFEPAQSRRTSSNRSMMDCTEPQAQVQRSFAHPSIVAWSAKTYEHMDKPSRDLSSRDLPMPRRDFGYPGQHQAFSNERHLPWPVAQSKLWANAKW